MRNTSLSCRWGLALLLLATFAWGPRPALAAGLFTVSGVSVDVTADSAAQAREQALAEGHLKAFRRLAERFVPAGLQGRIPSPAYDKVANLVRDFEVSNERTSDVRYLAELTFRFQPRAMRDYLRAQQVPFAQTRSKPVAVLPLFGAGANAVLWDGRNPWRDAWARWEPTPGLVPFAVPLGDLSDIQTISAREALDQDRARLRSLAERYGAGDVLITRAVLSGDPATGGARLQLVSRRVSPDGTERNWVEEVRQSADAAPEAMYDRGVRRVVGVVRNAWKQANVLRFDTEQSMDVSVPIGGLDQWVAVRERLADLPVVHRHDLRKLSRTGAELRLVFFGDMDQLRASLAQEDLSLREGEAGKWTLLLRGTQAARGGPAAVGVETLDAPVSTGAGQDTRAMDAGESDTGGSETGESDQP